ncbi:uncharacterized protein LOC103703783 isoform X2 [Phoenix dactylifera]|uniref:Uncharacterized protein LOC103703783 isoform X2 n=1 Tax=Phoenix dactylifera TaxID=42345 RepID=A0A8B7BTI1_PHODC|nr:uncharacterized protein LOC103703783 isoform X2 [Phoenix dactylifera]
MAEEGGAREGVCSFEWDEESKLYYHACSGFYHDPHAGWYYSSRDGLYYTYEDGKYVPLSSYKGEESEAVDSTNSALSEANKDNTCMLLEETLINLYLSGYSNSDINADSSSTTLQTNTSQVSSEEQSDQPSSDKLPGCYRGITCQQVEGELIPEDEQNAFRSSNRLLAGDASWDEENWKAQYGQVLTLEDEGIPSFPTVDLWDWEIVKDHTKKGHQIAKLIGRLVRRSSKLHPSVPAGGGVLKTAAIHAVHLDLVGVASGKVYRLRTPSPRYLASVSKYDSSNPTKDWGFPDLYADLQSSTHHSLNQIYGSDVANAANRDNLSASVDQVPVTVQKHQNLAYRDRAAERRMLHGGFGIGPGQKNVENGNIHELGSPSQPCDAEEAAAEAADISFGSGSYARRILESMGWKKGEALGRTTKGILEPLQAVGNKGYAGLGWNSAQH